IVWANLPCQRAHQTYQTQLRCRVGCSPKQGAFASHRTDHQNIARTTSQHRGKKGMATEVRTCKIDCEGLVPLLRRNLPERSRRTSNAAIIDQNINPSKVSQRLLSHSQHTLLLTQVEFNCQHIALK